MTREEYESLQGLVNRLLDESLIIPKPKFKVGDKVKSIERPWYSNIRFDNIRYDLEWSEWVYEDVDYEGTNDFRESELELVEAAK